MPVPLAYNVRSARERWTSSVVAVVGIAGTVGVFVAMLALARGVVAQDLTRGLLLIYLPGRALAAGAALALATGLLAGLLPALGAMRLSVVDAMRRI